MKVPWTEHKTNEEILKMVETERKLMDTVRSRQKRWLGHILRHDSLLRINVKNFHGSLTTVVRAQNDTTKTANITDTIFDRTLV